MLFAGIEAVSSPETLRRTATPRHAWPHSWKGATLAKRERSRQCWKGGGQAAARCAAPRRVHSARDECILKDVPPAAAAVAAGGRVAGLGRSGLAPAAEPAAKPAASPGPGRPADRAGPGWAGRARHI